MYHSYSAFIKSYSLQGDSEAVKSDAGLNGVSIGPLSLIYSNHSSVLHYHADSIYLTCINEGDEALTSVTANFNAEPPYWDECLWNNRASRTFENLNVQPGESFMIVWDSFNFHTPANNPQQVATLCFWLSEPTHRLDRNAANDGVCTDFLVADSEVNHDFKFNLYPNPASGSTHIEYEYNLNHITDAHLRITNPTGHLLQRHPLPTAEGHLLIENLPPGLYFVQLIAEGRILKTQKLLRL